MADVQAAPDAPEGDTRQAGAVVVVGEGLLARAVAQAVTPGRPPTSGRPSAAGPSAVVSANDCWVSEVDATRARCRDRGLPWLAVRAELGRVVVGPLERPGRPGCARCAEGRRARAREDPDGHAAVRGAHGAALALTPSPLLTTLAGHVVAELVAQEVEALHTAGDPRTDAAVLFVDLHTLDVSRHTFLPDPRCPDCRPASARAPDSGIVLRPRPKPRSGSDRVRPAPDPDALASRYVDAETGLIRTIQHGTSGGLTLARAPVGLRTPHRSGYTEAGYGRTRDYATSETVAICEALERYGGLRQGDAPWSVRAANSEIAERAVDVNTLGSYDPASYELPGFRCRPFDPEHTYTWVSGYSFRRGGPVLVPECLGYYGRPTPPEERPFFLETSNGAAVGGCVEEAILHGLLEVAERDAFLLAWHARMEVDALDPASAADRTIPLLVTAIEHQTGYEVHLFDTTAEHGIPCVWAMAVRTSEDPTLPKAVSTAGAHPDAERAVGDALAELGAILDGLLGRYPEERERAGRMVDDPFLVQEMEDHVLLYGDDRAFPRFAFLFRGQVPKPLSTLAGHGGPRIGDPDLTGDLLAIVQRFLDNGMDVIAVDQTTSEHRAGGLACAKVIVPGALPLTFGHAYRRLNGLPRLREAPVRLGYAARALADAELNTHPHPFP